MESQSLATPYPAARPRLYWVGTIAGAVLGAVLLFAVWAKALDPAAFAEQIRIEGLDFLFSAQAVALIALALEAGLGLALLLGVRRLWVLIPSVLLVAFFLFLTGRAWYLDAHGLREEAASCGCFGNLVQRTPAEAFWQDLAMLVPPLLLGFVGRDRRGPRFPPVRTAMVALVTLGVLVFTWKAPELPLDDLATRLRPGVEVKDLCAGAAEERVCLSTVAAGLGEGEHLVVIADLADPAFGESVDALNAAASDPSGPGVWLLSAATPEQVHNFRWTRGPVFQVVEAPPGLLRPLYRRLPRAFRVKDGRVTETYAGLPPLSQMAAGASSAKSPA
ncbi:MAG TPA: MauE/DoxX family redox-associated membrane protein [Thermoanaerobaculia bacterium]